MVVEFNGRQITFDDLEYQFLDKCDHSIFYECRGFDERGSIYSGSIEKCCDEYETPTDIELIIHARNMEKKPYQARVLLKSINYWQSVIDGELPAKRPLKYYTNKMEFYTKEDVHILIKKALYN